jgi:hypothetical protein
MPHSPVYCILYLLFFYFYYDDLRKVTAYLTETFLIYTGYYFVDIFQSPMINFTLFFAGIVSSEGKL